MPAFWQFFFMQLFENNYRNMLKLIYKKVLHKDPKTAFLRQVTQRHFRKPRNQYKAVLHFHPPLAPPLSTQTHTEHTLATSQLFCIPGPDTVIFGVALF